jgi:F-type H+-transporting ATPase subunit delta
VHESGDESPHSEETTMPDRFQRESEDAQIAAQVLADVGVEHIADVYADALVSSTEKAGRTDAVLGEFDAVVEELLERFPQLEAALKSARISHEEKSGLLDRVLGGRVSAPLLSFLKVVSRHGRLDCLRVIHRRAHRIVDQMRGRVHVRLTTAAPIDDALAAKLGLRLRELLGAEPIVHARTDPEVIGGMVVRVGDTVYDGSVANQLEQLRQQMIDRSAHEIQSRRERFRDPAGN